MPILFVVADVKRNELFFEWVNKASFTVIPEEREIVVHEIFAQHPQAV